MRIPEVEEVLIYGLELGFDFTQTEAEIIQGVMVEKLAALERFYGNEDR